MENPFKKGDTKSSNFTVAEEDLAKFDTGLVHRVCSTFKLAKEMEWAGRLFILEMKGDDEEGIGTRIEIKHINPAFLSEEVRVEATFNDLMNSELICDVMARVGDRIIAAGYTGQKIMNKEILEKRFLDISISK
jgi:fluoroacetyl-CoA thioesterase